MDAENRALCYFYRHPPPQSGVQPLSYRDICPLVYLKEKDAFGEPQHPSVAAVFKCVKQWARERKKRGRQTGWRKTTKAEDKQIHTCFQVVRKPLGKRIYARHVKVGLPPALKAKVSVRTVRRRLAEKGIKPERKLRKANRGPAWQRRLRLWCEKHKKAKRMWKKRLQGVADIKNFTFFPKG